MFVWTLIEAESKELQKRVRETENLLFQCLERQAMAECETNTMAELSLKAQAVVRILAILRWISVHVDEGMHTLAECQMNEKAMPSCKAQAVI